MELYRIISPQRSGNHAIISWLMSQFPNEGVVFFSNSVIGTNPEKYHARLEYNGNIIKPQDRDTLIAHKIIRMASKIDTVIVSYENKDISLFEYSEPASVTVGYDTGLRMNILVSRSFFNWLASTYMLVDRNMNGAAGTQLWNKEMLRRIDNWFITNRVGRILEQRDPDHNLVASYDDWFVNPTYRQHLLDRIGLKSTFLELPKVQNYGGGSSFDRMRYKNDPEGMQTLSRWRHFIDEQIFKDIVSIAFDIDGFDTFIATYFPLCKAIKDENF